MVVPGQLGNTQEVQNGFEVLKKTYVQARQRIFNDTFTWYLKTVFGVPATFSLNAPPPILGSGDVENETNKAIVSLSPLVANKVLEKMTDNEIRALASLPPLEGGDVIPSSVPGAPVFKKENKFKYTNEEERIVLRSLASCGRKKFRYIVKESRRVPVDFTDDWFETSEKELLESISKDKLFFATILTELQKNVLSLIDEGNDANSIAKALNKSIQSVMDAYNELSQKGLIKKDGELSSTGKRYLDVTEIPAEDFEIRYSYELRPDAPKLSKTGTGESRPFCKKLIDLERLYTRAEIDKISLAVGRNVFNFRGGWYHNPDTQQNTPFCRHTWLQQIVIKRK
jgi:predicted transcriptional regulator